MNIIARVVSGAIISSLSLCLVAVAQAREAVPVNPAIREDNLQRQRELQRNIDNELRETQEKAQAILPPSLEAHELEQGEETFKFPISKILVEAGEGKPRVDVTDIVDAYVGQALGNLGLFNLVREVTNRYVEQGYATTTVSLLPQNLKQGELTLLVRWGLVEGWLINGAPAETLQDQLMVKMLMPGIVGQPLNMHAVDQAIESLNNGAKNARVEIVSAKRAGYSYLNIITAEADGARGKYSLGVNNSSVETTSNGRYQSTLAANWGDVVFGNDRLSANIASRYYNEEFGNDEYSGGFSYSLPFGYSELTLRYSHSSYHKEILGYYGSYLSNGNQDTWGLRFANTLWRNRTDKLTFFSELELKDSANYIQDTFLEVNSKPYRSLTAGLQYVTPVLGGSLFADVAYSRGLSAFGGTPAAFDDDQQNEHFKRLQSNLAWTRPFAVLDKNFEYSSRLSGQYGYNSMLATYQFGIGDEYTVRGYKGTPSFGDSGVYLSNTITHSIPFDGFLGAGTLAFYTGLDWGRVKNLSAGGGQASTLTGGVLGVRSNWKHVGASLGVGRPFKQVEGVDLPAEAVYLNLSASY